ncbi:MAG: Fic family protein [Chitinispirillia bacterium]|nr:Fic family protein [Chitinispirillia bacterium]MCL2241998.1 Fic family protein [Chitinispirillia bacterium]
MGKTESSYTPPFTLSARAVSMIAEIAALAERVAIRMEQQDALRLRKINRIKTIHASLAIEGNTLTESQVTAIMEGRKVVAPLREIQEVKNAIAAYDMYHTLDPFSADDMLTAHGAMMTALVDDPGAFRSGGVGITNGIDVIHVAPPASRVPGLMADLFRWLKNAPDHLLVRSCVFHYEFEFIHPFSDGNGRMGRMWQSLILGRFQPFFRHMPVETMVHRNQQDYYAALGQSTENGDCGVFVDFMLSEILQTMKPHVVPIGEMVGGVNGGVSGGVTGGVNEVLDYIGTHPGCRANEIEKAISIPLRSVERHLAALKNSGKIEFQGAPKTGGYRRTEP